MAASLLILLREGLEAALIVAIILAYLNRIGQQAHFRNVWLGTAGAIAVSLLAGAIVFATAGGLSEKAEETFEGIAMLTATGVLTYMIFWMRKQARFIKGELQNKVDSALKTSSAWALAAIPFVFIIREGLETVLFMFAIVKATSPLGSTVGGLLGLGIAIVLGFLVYKGSHRLNLRAFFNITGLLLILFAAGLLARGLYELQEVGVIPILVTEHLWDINYLLNEKGAVGSLLKSLFGYNGNPSFLEVMAYLVYLFWAGWFYLFPTISSGRRESSKELVREQSVREQR